MELWDGATAPRPQKMGRIKHLIDGRDVVIPAGKRLAGGEVTCGTCRRLIQFRDATGPYHKCNQIKGDVRKSPTDPACTVWRMITT